MRSTRPPQRRGVAVNTVATAASTVVLTGAAAVVGALVSREFGRSEATDGFFAAYGIYVALVLVATALRVVVLPTLVRARVAAQLPAEIASYAIVIALVAAPAVVAALVAPNWLGALLTATPAAEATAADAIQWLVPAAVAQIYAGLAASALAADDEYVVAATGFALGASGGLALIFARLDTGVISLAEGIALNGAISVVYPCVALARRGHLTVATHGTLRPAERLAQLAQGVGLQFAVQGLLLVGLRSAGLLGVGEQTSFSYAYLIAASVVAITATSFSLVTVAPLTRLGMTTEGTARYVASMVWLSAVPIVLTGIVLGVAGEPLLQLALGSSFAGDAGREVGLLVLYLTPWMLVSAGVSIVFPLLFVARRARLLPALALLALLVHVPLDLVGRELGGIVGIVHALSVTTTLVLVSLIALLPGRVLGAVGRALVRTRPLAAWTYARTLR